MVLRTLAQQLPAPMAGAFGGKYAAPLAAPVDAAGDAAPHLAAPLLGLAVPEALPSSRLSSIADIERELSGAQFELDSLRAEIDLLRRRDETLNYYMNRLDEELRLAARLQQDFLPRNLPPVGPLRFSAMYRPAGYVSGDLYDVMRLDEGHVGFYTADAVGHGMPAALLTMFVRQALVTKDIPSTAPGGYRLLEPGEALARLNAVVLEQNLAHAAFATAVYGVIDANTLRLHLGKAGHPNPLLQRRNGSVESLAADGPLLGIFAGEPYDTQSVQLRPGDRLFVYTDGIEIAFPTAENATSPRWEQELTRRRHLGAEELLADLARHLDQESGSLDPRDDLTLMVIDVAE